MDGKLFRFYTISTNNNKTNMQLLYLEQDAKNSKTNTYFWYIDSIKMMFRLFDFASSGFELFSFISFWWSSFIHSFFCVIWLCVCVFIDIEIY